MASAVHKNTETKAASVNVNSVCRQNTVEQGMAAPDEFMAEVQWSMAIRKMIAKLEFGDALKLLMNDRDMSVEKMESESGLSVSTVKRLRAGQEASAEQVVAISVALRLPPMVSSDLLRMCGITLDFNNQRNTCLLYTSDAADEEDSVDLGGRRIINKKKKAEEEDRKKKKKKTEEAGRDTMRIMT